MPIISDEPNGLVRAFETIPLRLINGVEDTIQTSPAITFDVFSDGELLNPEAVLPPIGRVPLGSIELYVYEFDLQSYARSKLTLDNFPPVAAPGVRTSPTWQARITANVYDWLPDPDDFERLVKSATYQEINGVTAIPAIRSNDDPETLDQYSFSTADNSIPVLPLTRKPATSLISLDDSEWLPVWSESLTMVRIRTFNAAGTTIHDGQFETGYTNEDPYVMQIGVGPANIAAMDPAAFISGTAPVMDKNVSSYTVEVGQTCNNGNNFAGFHEPRKYFIKPAYCRTCRIHFINSFGFVDSFSIWSNISTSYRFKSEKAAQGQRTFDPAKPGTYRVSIVADKQISLVAGGITQQQQQWLATELAKSPRSVIEIEGKYYAVYLKDSDFEVTDTQSTVPELSFTLIFSNQEFSQSA